MKKFLLFSMMLSLLCSSPGLVLAEAEIYWGTAPSRESDITDADFSHKYEGKDDYSLFREKEIYQVWKPGLFDDEEEAGVVVSQPIQEPVPSAPVIERRTPTTRPEIGATPRSTESARPSSTTPARVSPAAPKPAETSPGTQDAASGANQSNVEKPGTKKMKWGQSDTPSASEPKAKFEWGQNKPGN